jgi:hypothetical protein
MKTLEIQVGQFLLGCKCPVSRFLPGRAKDLSAPLYLASVNGHATGYKVQIFMCKLHNINTFLTLALHGGEQGATCPACFTPKERHHKNH